MAEATNPIATASNPRVGEDIFGDFDSADYKPDLASAIAAEIMGLKKSYRETWGEIGGLGGLALRLPLSAP